MQTIKFLLIPNHSALYIDGDFFIEAAESSLLSYIGSISESSAIAAFIDAAGNTSLPGKIDTRVSKVHSLHVFQGKINSAKKAINYIFAFIKLPFILRRYNRIYIFFPGNVSLMAAFWARLLNIHYGLYVRGSWLNPNGAQAWWWHRVLSGSTYMIVTGEAFRKRLMGYHKNVVNEVPLTAFTPASVSPQPFSESRDLAMLFVGRLSASKGIADTLLALAQLKREGVTATLYVAGGGTTAELASIHSLIAEHQLHTQVHLLGHVTSSVLADYYRRCRIFVFPSYFAEGFPRVLYEAMMFSMAIITCEMPGTEGFLLNQINCLYCRPADSADLAKKIAMLYDNKSTVARLGEHAREDVERLYKSFDKASHAEQLERFIRP